MSDSKDIKDLEEEDIDEDEILAMLSPEELRELQSEMDVIIAPDEKVPVGQRQKDQTEKPPTGTFDHRSLVDYLYWEKESKRMLEEERVPTTLLPSEKVLNEEAEKKERAEMSDNVKYEVYEVIEEVIEDEAADCEDGEEIIEEVIEEIVEEVDEADERKEEDLGNEDFKQPDKDKSEDDSKNHEELSGNTEEVQEKRNTGDIQPNSEPPVKQDTPETKENTSTDSTTPPQEPEKTESNEILKPKEEKKINKLKIPNLAHNIKMTSRPSGNETNLESTLDKIRNNNPSVTEVNLNNIENIPKEILLDYVTALKKNKHVKTFSIANTGVDENIAFNLANMLRENRSITTLNIESNFVTGKGIVAIIRCLQFNESLTELRFHNQRHMLGHHAEMEISRLLKANNTLLKMGYHFEQPGPRMVVTNILTRNLDRQRQQRKEEQRQQQLKEQRELMQMYENSLNLPPGLLQMLGYIPPMEALQDHGLVPPSSEVASVTQNHNATEKPEPPKQQKKHKSIPKQASTNSANPLQNVQLKRTPKKRDPFLELDARDSRRAERESFQLRKTPRVKDSGSGEMSDEKANLTDVIKTLKPIPRRRVPPKVDPTPRDQLLSEIKTSNVAYLKSVPLPKVLESSETSLL
ncbi:leiomodin-3 isoform X2 [Gouania willdenowi]|uniref:leiomodin-3 isoform X2 n=1 Tax=Gouania willdenowi TaxID=441366 RepID=UPI0010564E85|nr:leiomodin-3 isoform X2 [Gouania willdenowi]